MYKIIAIAAFPLCSLQVFSQTTDKQNVEIVGTIKDKNNNQILQGSLTLYTGSSIIRGFTVANREGHFKLSAPLGNYHLIIAYSGYQAEERTLILTKTQYPRLDLKVIKLRKYK